MLCSYFISKLYLKSIGFSFFSLYYFFGFLLTMIFQLNLDFFFVHCVPLATVDCSLPCCKEFLIGQFLCHQVSVWAKKNRQKRQKKKTKQFQHQQ